MENFLTQISVVNPDACAKLKAGGYKTYQDLISTPPSASDLDECGFILIERNKILKAISQPSGVPLLASKALEPKWTSDAPVTERNWHIPLEELHLETLKQTILSGEFQLVHGHPRSGKTSHRWALTRYLTEQLKWLVISVQFDATWQRFPTAQFWKKLHYYLSTRYPEICKFEDAPTFPLVFDSIRNKKMCLLFDEFQYILGAAWKDSLLSSLKSCRDSANETSFSGCLAFGTYNITKLTTEDISLSPFPSSNIFHMKAPNSEQFKSTLVKFRSFRNFQFSRYIIDDILQATGDHLGIYGLLGYQLQHLVETEDPLPINDGFKSLWQQRKCNFYQLMYGNSVFEVIIRLLSQHDNRLMKLIENCKLHLKESFILSGTDAEVLISYGVFTFVNAKRSLMHLKWTSPLLKEFIIQYAITIKTELPSAPLLGSKLDYVSLFNILGQQAEVASLLSWDQEEIGLFDPLEAAFQAEYYRVLKGIFCKTRWLEGEYKIIYEGRLGSGRRRMDLLIIDGETTVVEMKILRQGLSLNNIIQSGINQVFDYANSVGASRAYLLICSNYRCTLESPVMVSRVPDEAEDDDYFPSQPDPCDSMEIINLQQTKVVKIILFQYSENWYKFLSCTEVEVKVIKVMNE